MGSQIPPTGRGTFGDQVAGTPWAVDAFCLACWMQPVVCSRGRRFGLMLPLMQQLVITAGVMWLEVTIASRRVLLLLHFAGMLLPTLLLMSLFYNALLMFVPVMGRVGTVPYPDLIIGCMVVSSVIVLSVWQVTLNSLCMFISTYSTLCKLVTVIQRI